jgi:hypothetical protein
MADNADLTQQDATIAKLARDGWVVVQPQVAVTDGSVLMKLVTPTGDSHIVVMLNGDRVDARQKLGKLPPVPSQGAPP